MLLKIAWRNIWRNKRRTYITCSAILFAVLSSIFAYSLQHGTWDYVIDNVVKFHFGYVQVHKTGYWEDKSMDLSMEWNEDLQKKLTELPTVSGFTPRLEGVALAYNFTDTNSLAVMIVGTEPSAEDQLSSIQSRVVAGTYFDKADKAILVAKGLALKMKLNIGDTLTLISQGYHGANAAGRYPIKGIVRFGAPDLNKQMVYLPLQEAQWFFSAEGMVNSIVLHISGRYAVAKTLADAKSKLDRSQYEVMQWEELIPGIVQARDLKLAGNTVILGVLYIIIGFGILGTILMMTKERQYEFGVLTAIGMKRRQLAFSIWLETTMLGLLGAFLGMLCAFPLVAYFHYNPINMGKAYADTFAEFGLEPVLPTALDANIFISQTILVFVMTTILALYPMFKILQLKPIKAMRGQ